MYTTLPHLYEELSDDYLRATKKTARPTDRAAFPYRMGRGEQTPHHPTTTSDYRTAIFRRAKPRNPEHTERM